MILFALSNIYIFFVELQNERVCVILLIQVLLWLGMRVESSTGGVKHQMRLTLVRTSPPLQLCTPADRRCDHSACIRANASCICSGLNGVLASGGGKNSELDGRVYSSSGDSSRLLFSGGPPIPMAALRLPIEGEVYSSRTEDSSSDFLTARPARVMDRTISKARKPTMSTVSSLARRSSWEGRLRNSRKRLAFR